MDKTKLLIQELKKETNGLLVTCRKDNIATTATVGELNDLVGLFLLQMDELAKEMDDREKLLFLTLISKRAIDLLGLPKPDLVTQLEKELGL